MIFTQKTKSPANPSQQSQPLAPRQGPRTRGRPALCRPPLVCQGQTFTVSNEQPLENIVLKQKRELHRETAKVELKSFCVGDACRSSGMIAKHKIRN
ncbi:unnamed protein product [Arctogadus glacialis]